MPDGQKCVMEPGIEQPKSGRGPGRPPGSKNIWSASSRMKLNELGFNPIEKMVEQYEAINKEIAELKARDRPPTMTIATLMMGQQKLISDLLRYGYGRVTEVQEVRNPDLKPVQIILTKDGFTPREPNGEDLSDIPPELFKDTLDGQSPT